MRASAVQCHSSIRSCRASSPIYVLESKLTCQCPHRTRPPGDLRARSIGCLRGLPLHKSHPVDYERLRGRTVEASQVALFQPRRIGDEGTNWMTWRHNAPIPTDHVVQVRTPCAKGKMTFSPQASEAYLSPVACLAKPLVVKADSPLRGLETSCGGFALQQAVPLRSIPAM